MLVQSKSTFRVIIILSFFFLIKNNFFNNAPLIIKKKFSLQFVDRNFRNFHCYKLGPHKEGKSLH